MTDGNTVATINPVQATQEEVGIMRGMFEKFANTVVQASQLSIDLEALRVQLHNLKLDVDTYRARIAELDNELTYVRKARDDAHEEINSLKNDRDTISKDRDFWKSTVDTDAIELKTLRDDLASARKDRDEASYRNLELQEALDKANAKLEKFKATFEQAFNEDKQPAPEKLPEPWGPPATPVAKRIYQDEPGFDWARTNYDPDRGQYYTEVAA